MSGRDRGLRCSASLQWRAGMATGVALSVFASAYPAAALPAQRVAAKHAKASYVSGRLSAPGYTVAVVGFNGKARFSHHRSFRLLAPDSKVTVQLIDQRGKYAGPVVLAAKATRVITGVKAGTNLGTIVVVRSKGYARLARKLPKGRLVNGRWAHAKRGVPIGNGRNLGLVRAKREGSSSAPGADPAHIGVPNAFNVALPGTRVLKALAPSSTATARQATPPQPSGPGEAPAAPPPGPSPWMSYMVQSMDETVNADAAGVTQAGIDATLKANLKLILLQTPSGTLVELDCNGLSYCSPSGSGQAEMQGLPKCTDGPDGPGSFGGEYCTRPFPADFLDPGTGFGEIVGPEVPTGLPATSRPGGGSGFVLQPHATSTEIGSGDVITQHATDNGVETQTPATIGFVYTTVPTIATWSDSAGNSGAIAYPNTAGIGTDANPLQVAAGPDGHVVVSLTIWRPQRFGVAGAGEPAFMDIGNLGYQINYTHSPRGMDRTRNMAFQCPNTSYSGLSADLRFDPRHGFSGNPVSAPEQSWMLDAASDRPASPANTISFSVDLTQCAAYLGTDSFPTGKVFGFELLANSQMGVDHASQGFEIERTR